MNKPLKTYMVLRDSYYSHIVTTYRPVDNVTVFGTMKGAKASLLEDLRRTRNALNQTIRGILSIKESELLSETHY